LPTPWRAWARTCCVGDAALRELAEETSVTTFSGHIEQLRTYSVAEPFTLADLRRVYAAVWGKAPDLGNFRRKVLGTEGFVIEAQRSQTVAAGPAGGRLPLMYRRGAAVTLHPPPLRPRKESHL
jgi:hypothetical protein